MIATPNFVERREHERVVSSVPLKLSHAQGDSVTETINLSRSGAYCRIRQYIQPMTKLKIQLLLPLVKSGKTTNKKISCEGVVVRSEPAPQEGHFNVAIFFSDITPSNVSVLTDFVDHVAQK